MFGFIILSHKAPGQMQRLVRTLNALYDNPPIACHHDFSQTRLDKTAFPSNVHFVEPHIATGWGRWSLVRSSLAALELLYEIADPDFFFLISVADYPTAKPERVQADLLRSGADAYIDSFSLEQAMTTGVAPGDPQLAHHRAPYNLVLEQGRYLRAQIKIPIVRFKPPGNSTSEERYPRLGRITKVLAYDSPLSPFDDDYKCYVGSQWFTANRRAAHKLLNPSKKDRHLQRYYKNRVVPDESYVQTVLCNDSEITVEDRTFRYSSWNGGGAHPVDLGVPDLEAILASDAHFARKFAENDPVLDLIDEHLGL